MRPRRFAPTSTALAIALLAVPAAHGDTKTWSCSSSYWDYEDCWTPFGLPAPADNAFVGIVGGVNTVLRFDDFTDLRTVNGLTIEAPLPGPTVTFEQTGGGLTTFATVVADYSQGLYKQSGGTHTTGYLNLGYFGGAGHYQLQGGVLNSDRSSVGSEFNDFGDTWFEQTGGTHATGSLQVLRTYRLLGGTLRADSNALVTKGGLFTHRAGSFNAGQLIVGSSFYGPGRYDMGQGNGALDAREILLRPASDFHQGGSASVKATTLVVGSGGSATYRQDGGTLLSGVVQLGDFGNGTFTQSAGTHTVSGGLAIDSTGRYVLSGGTLSLTGAARAVNDGVFEFTGGSFAGTIENRGQLVIGVVGGPELTFGGHVLNQGSIILNTSARFNDGLRNDVDLDLLPTGRTLTLLGRGLENNGVFTMRGGTLDGWGPLTNHNQLSGHGVIDGYEFHNFGHVAQTGGTLALKLANVVNAGRWSLEAQRDLKLDDSWLVFQNYGVLALNGGRVTGDGLLQNFGAISGSGQIQSPFQNQGTLGILHGEQVTLTSGLSNAGLIDLRGSGASLVLTSGQLNNQGLLAGHGRVNAWIDNQADGRIQAEGGVLSLRGQINNAGLMVAEAGGTLLLQQPVASQTGTLQLNGGTIDMDGNALRNDGIVGGHGTLRGIFIQNAGQMQFSAGSTQVHGVVDNLNGGRIIVSGTGVATFYGAVQALAGSEIRVSTDSAAVFFGTVSQANGAAFTGDGTRYFEGGLSVGDSPGAGGSQGNVVFGSANVYRAEIGGLVAGSGFDHFAVGDRLSLGGTLALSWWGGFEAQAGQRFDLFDWGSVSGSFAAIDLAAAALDPGLRWDTSRLYLDGSITVAAVPEPAPAAMLLAGLAALWRLRRRPSASPEGGC